jgi:hypothetical protein
MPDWEEVGHKHNYCIICSSTDTTKVQPTKLCPKYIWVDVIARFVCVLSRQSGVAIFGNRPREVLLMQESLKHRESITRYTAPDFYKKTGVLYEAPGNLLQVNRMDYRFEGKNILRVRVTVLRGSTVPSARTVCNDKLHIALLVKKYLSIWEIKSKADRHRK